jgi:glycosyltransferase involved in cell wall biosynthesis/SAM-dependent methyltransferase
MNASSMYDNAYHEDNVYGLALGLLKGYVQVQPLQADRIHLDIGCGYGRVAEPLTQALGLTYVGVDADPSGIASLRVRGFEAHQLALGDEEETTARLESVVAGRRVVSISFLDTLEHLPAGTAVLNAIRRIATPGASFVVMSVPNVTHVDIASKLLCGRWDYTEAGLLDRTHLQLFSDSSLSMKLAGSGLHVVDACNVDVPLSDQHFPIDHAALSAGSLLHQLIDEMRQRCDEHATTQQFVRLCVPGQPISSQEEQVGENPFLSVLVRTQGKRIHTLTEVFTSLAAQSDIDFEIVVVGHRLENDDRLRVERTIDDCPEWLRKKIRLLKLNDGNRTKPLNFGFEHARGSYVAILDDDDMPMAHWVETFHDLHRRHPGRVLRAVSVRQDVRTVGIRGHQALRAEGTLETLYTPHFDLFEHLVENQSPPVSLAFPRSLFRDLQLRFDEDLTTTEDWDYLLRCVALVGVSNTSSVTSIYRWWVDGHSSRSEHNQDEWRANYDAISRKLDRTLFVLPEGSVSKIRLLVRRAGGAVAPAFTALNPDSSAQDTAWLREILLRHMLSNSWKLSGPLRLLARIGGGKKIRFDFQQENIELLKEQIRRIRGTASWRYTRFMRTRKAYWWDRDI